MARRRSTGMPSATTSSPSRGTGPTSTMPRSPPCPAARATSCATGSPSRRIDGVVGWPDNERRLEAIRDRVAGPDQRRPRRDRLHQQHDPGDRPDRRGLSLARGRHRRHGRRRIPVEPLSLDEPGEPGRRRPAGPQPRRTDLARGPGRGDRPLDAGPGDQPRRVRHGLPQRPGCPGRALPGAGDRPVRRRDPGARPAPDRRAADADRLPGRRRAQVAARPRGRRVPLRPARLDRSAPADRRRLAQRRRLVQCPDAPSSGSSPAPSAGKAARSTCPAC